MSNHRQRRLLMNEIELRDSWNRLSSHHEWIRRIPADAVEASAGMNLSLYKNLPRAERMAGRARGER